MCPLHIKHKPVYDQRALINLPTAQANKYKMSFTIILAEIWRNH